MPSAAPGVPPSFDGAAGDGDGPRPAARRARRTAVTRDSAERERLRHVSAQLKTLYHMGRDLGEDENWSDALDRFLMALVSFMEAEGAGLLLFSDGERALSARAAFHLDDSAIAPAIETVREGWRRHARAAEIHCLESYTDGRATSCLERAVPWHATLIPLRHRGRPLGFLLLDKAYASGSDFQWDYHFLSTLQTIFAEEIANASYISELRQLSRFNQNVLDNIHSGVVTTDLDGNVRYANAWAAEMCPRLRAAASRVTPIRFDDLFRVAGGNAGDPGRFLEPAGDGEVFEVECHGGRAAAFPARLRVTRMHDDHLNGTVVVAIFDDLSEQRRMEDALRRNDRLRALGQLSASVAHEIRNPLAGIATTAEVLGSRLADRDDARPYIKVMLEEITRLDGIVRNLLAFARPPRPHLAPCAVSELVARVQVLAGDEAALRGIRLLTHAAPELRCVADGQQLTQVLLNLVQNAVQACAAGDTVRLDAAEDAAAGVLDVCVTDSGPGIAEEVRGTLFDPFVTTRTQGTGLGLAICRQIVEDHRGTIVCEPLERGTRFRVRLPVPRP